MDTNELPERAEAVCRFMREHATPDLVKLIDENMEMHVDPVEPGTDRTYMFRVPRREPGKQPPLHWDLEKHAKRIGFSGWDWVNCTSRWLCIDIDTREGHKHTKGQTDEQIRGIIAKLSAVPWVTIRYSKSGRGIHAFVAYAKPVPTSTRNEHAELARVVIAILSKEVGIDLMKVGDAKGVLAWLWARETNEKSFALIKEGVPFDGVPEDWRSLVPRRKKRSGEDAKIDGLLASVRRVDLEDEHLRLLTWFEEHGDEASWEWDEEDGLLRCHTASLRDAHAQLGLDGVFRTASDGTDLDTPNCFAFPRRGGAWSVRRYGQGVQEDSTWRRDESGWTRCEFNAPATLAAAATAHAALEDGRDGFAFARLEDALAALADLGINVQSLAAFHDRPASLTRKPSRVVLRVERRDEKAPEGFVRDQGRGSWWLRQFPHDEPRQSSGAADSFVRSVFANRTDAGLYVKTPRGWVATSTDKARAALVAQGQTAQAAQAMLGDAVLDPWELVVEPFAEEYGRDRRWNLNAARLSKKAEPGPHPHWDLVLAHLGQSLDEAVREHSWCRDAGIASGADYLRAWVASLFQHPEQPLPYLLFVSPEQNTGKSTFHEALALLFAKDGDERRGYAFADRALTNDSGFNQELLGSVLCVTEETDLRVRRAYERMKNWLNSPTLAIRALFRNQIHVPNFTHWVQCANSAAFCPIDSTDERVVVIEVRAPKTEIPKPVLMEKLDEEGAAFLHTALTMNLPTAPGRLRVPLVVTRAKLALAQANLPALAHFLAEETKRCNGAKIQWSVFWNRFLTGLDVGESRFWTRRRVQQDLAQAGYPVGRSGDNCSYVGNIAWIEDEKPQRKLSKILKLRGGRLVEEDDDSEAGRVAA